MTKEEILKIKEHIEIHSRRESRAIRITEIMWKAVGELERIAQLEKENAKLKEQIEKMKCCGNCARLCECGIRGDVECNNYDKWELREKYKKNDFY